MLEQIPETFTVRCARCGSSDIGSVIHRKAYDNHVCESLWTKNAIKEEFELHKVFYTTLAWYMNPRDLEDKRKKAKYNHVYYYMLDFIAETLQLIVYPVKDGHYHSFLTAGNKPFVVQLWDHKPEMDSNRLGNPKVTEDYQTVFAGSVMDLFIVIRNFMIESYTIDPHALDMLYHLYLEGLENLSTNSLNEKQVRQSWIKYLKLTQDK